MRVELKALQRRLSITVVFVTHDQVEAMTLSDRLAVMNRGKIEQLASPREIYTKPGTSFVQEFLGRVIWMEGSVLESKSESVVIRLEGEDKVQIRCHANEMRPNIGDTVVVAVRPEEVRVCKEKEGEGFNQVPCEVETAVFLGDRYECHLRFGPMRFTLYTAVGESYSSGQKVYVNFPENAVRIWRKEEASLSAAP